MEENVSDCKSMLFTLEGVACDENSVVSRMLAVVSMFALSLCLGESTARQGPLILSGCAGGVCDYIALHMLQYSLGLSRRRGFLLV